MPKFTLGNLVNNGRKVILEEAATFDNSIFYFAMSLNAPIIACHIPDSSVLDWDGVFPL